uniref:CSON002501 protein n=1 Tax=Culicoides sonorensis TaxID=179676 RepID=A0A336MNS3_CULSO
MFDSIKKLTFEELNRTENLVHPDWEVIDPNPDIKKLKIDLDFKFFEGRLKNVEVIWSSRLFRASGVCHCRRYSRIFGESCLIRLSELLLKFRSRKEIIETLLHEMIHAYLFFKKIPDNHGYYFHYYANKINSLAGTNIQVYHQFIDEVKFYERYIFRCDGICQLMKPCIVKRFYDNPPSSQTPWVKKHREWCDGVFVKIKEPKPQPQAKRKSNIEDNSSKRVKTSHEILNDGHDEIFRLIDMDAIERQYNKILNKSGSKSEKQKKSHESDVKIICDEENKPTNCPICNQAFALSELKEHLSQCLEFLLYID